MKPATAKRPFAGWKITNAELGDRRPGGCPPEAAPSPLLTSMTTLIKHVPRVQPAVRIKPQARLQVAPAPSTRQTHLEPATGARTVKRLGEANNPRQPAHPAMLKRLET